MTLNTSIYHTKISALADCLESAMEEYFNTNTTRGSLSSIFGPSKQKKAAECVRAAKMITILQYLKRGLRTCDEAAPLSLEAKAILMLAYDLLDPKSKKIYNVLLSKIIDRSAGAGGLAKCFNLDAPIGSYQLGRSLTNHKNRCAIRYILYCDLRRSGIIRSYHIISTPAIDLLLNGKFCSDILKVPVTLACIWKYRKNETVFVHLNGDVFRIIMRLVVDNLKIIDNLRSCLNHFYKGKVCDSS